MSTEKQHRLKPIVASVVDTTERIVRMPDVYSSVQVSNKLDDLALAVRDLAKVVGHLLDEQVKRQD